MILTEVRRSWIEILHRKADAYRADWAEYVAQWEADTEPGYPMTGWDESRKNLALAFADLYDSLADGLRTRADSD